MGRNVAVRSPKLSKTAKAVRMAAVSSGAQILRMSGGMWAGTKLAERMAAGLPLTTDALRTADMLRKDEWKVIDTAVVEEGVIRLRGIADLISAGLTTNISNGFGKTLFEYERVNDLDEAGVSMDGMTRTDDDTVEFDLRNLPLPIIHKDFNLNMRRLAASRERGESLDTMQARFAARRVTEKAEEILFAGYPRSFAGSQIYGYTNHPDRVQTLYGTGGAWTGAKTGEEMLVDVLTMITGLKALQFFGPYALYVGPDSEQALQKDFKTNSDKSVRMRLLEVDGLESIRVADSVPAGHIILVQLTSDVVTLVQGEPLQTVQWEINGGMQVNFKVLTIMVPLIRSNISNQTGIYDMHT